MSVSAVCTVLNRMAHRYAALTGRQTFLYGGDIDGTGIVSYVFNHDITFTTAAAALDHLSRLLRQAEAHHHHARLLNGGRT